MTAAVGDDSLRAAVAANKVWYHTLELAPGVVTPGWFDLRKVVEGLPWPDVRGARCLDVGTYDGQLAFELERRGASEVVALDIPDHECWDWPPDARAKGTAWLKAVAGPEKGVGFRVASEALGSRVERVDMTVYDISPQQLGTFDVVVCGSLMLHLRDPLRALEAIRSVCDGVFLSSEEIDLALSVLHPRRALSRVDGGGDRLQWLVPNVAGHRRMVFAAGFEVIVGTRPHCEPLGEGHPARPAALRPRRVRAFRSVFAGGTGVPHAAVLARPRV